MGKVLNDRVSRWVAAMGISPSRAPTPTELNGEFRGLPEPCRPGVSSRAVDNWERRHGYPLPDGLRAWLVISDGFYAGGPLIHPLSAIGPMVPFARVPELVVQPESWFELGNPNVETVCLDLGYTWPGPAGGAPVFTSGDDLTGSRPRVIAPSFEAWFLEVLRRGGREYWFEAGSRSLGSPWDAHRQYVPPPPLPDRLRPLAPTVLPMMHGGVDDRSIASTLGITRHDVETLLRHLQHASQGR